MACHAYWDTSEPPLFTLIYIYRTIVSVIRRGIWAAARRRRRTFFVVAVEIIPGRQGGKVSLLQTSVDPLWVRGGVLLLLSGIPTPVPASPRGWGARGRVVGRGFPRGYARLLLLLLLLCTVRWGFLFRFVFYWCGIDGLWGWKLWTRKRVMCVIKQNGFFFDEANNSIWFVFYYIVTLLR